MNNLCRNRGNVPSVMLMPPIVEAFTHIAQFAQTAQGKVDFWQISENSVRYFVVSLKGCIFVMTLKQHIVMESQKMKIVGGRVFTPQGWVKDAKVVVENVKI